MTNSLEPAGPREGSFPSDGLRLHYLDWPAGDGSPTVVLLHGGGQTAWTWRQVAARLVPEARCVAPDLRGHGDSDWHPDGAYGLVDHAADVEAAVVALGLEAPLLVGMSLGAMVALTVAGRGSVRQRALVLVDAGPGGSREAGREQLRPLLEPSSFATLDEAVQRALDANPRRDPAELERRLRRNMRQSADGSWTWKWDPRIRWRTSLAGLPQAEVERLVAEREASLWTAASKVKGPVLVVRGGDSEMFLDDDAERTAAAFHDARLVVIPGAGHYVQSDRPVELATAIRGLLSSPASPYGGW